MPRRRMPQAHEVAREWTKRQEKALTDVANTSLFAKACVEQRDAEIRMARKLGISLRDIARAAHLGHTTVARIVGGARNAGAK